MSRGRPVDVRERPAGIGSAATGQPRGRIFTGSAFRNPPRRAVAIRVAGSVDRAFRSAFSGGFDPIARAALVAGEGAPKTSACPV